MIFQICGFGVMHFLQVKWRKLGGIDIRTCFAHGFNKLGHYLLFILVIVLLKRLFWLQKK